MREETLFVYPPKEESGALQNVLMPAGAAPARVEEVQLTEAITELVKAGLGVAILARWAVQPLLDAGALVGRTLPARGMRRVWSAVMRKDFAARRLRQRVHRSARRTPDHAREPAVRRSPERSRIGASEFALRTTLYRFSFQVPRRNSQALTSDITENAMFIAQNTPAGP